LVAQQAVCFGLAPSDFIDSLRFPRSRDEFSPIRFRPTRLAPKHPKPRSSHRLSRPAFPALRFSSAVASNCCFSCVESRTGALGHFSRAERDADFFPFGQRFLVAQPMIRLSSSFLLPCFGLGFRSSFPVQTPVPCSTSPRVVFVVAAAWHTVVFSPAQILVP
jgi:hypothetical protein